ncbi:glycosyltransferase [Enterobacter mori]|uniref:glycosyltransferase n=1 Tax=Enterobacter mori TaxID=539813 RepID=UPI003B83E07E
MPTETQLQTLIDGRLCVKGKVELWLWTTSSIVSRFQRDYPFMNNIVIRNINSVWSNPFSRELPVAQLHSIFERESRGAFYNYAAASDIVRLMLLYCYGGIYLDMDVQCKKLDFFLFSELTDIGDRLGILEDRYGYPGNGVLASMPQSRQVKICLEKMKQLYCSDESRVLSWNIKRDYGAMRMPLTISMSGPQMICDTIQPEQLYHIKENKYFELIGDRGLSYTLPPKLMRWDSVPDFGH